MKYRMLEVVTLQKDLAEFNLRKGEKGTIVEVYTDSMNIVAYEVEFVDSKGKTTAMLTLREDEIEKV